MKKILRLLGLISLMLLASIGMAISGAVPVPPAQKKNTTEENVNDSENDSTTNPNTTKQ